MTSKKKEIDEIAGEKVETAKTAETEQPTMTVQPTEPTAPNDTVSKAEFDEVVRRLNEVTTLLRQVSDPVRLAKATAVAPKSGTRARVTYHNGQPVVGWRMLEDVVVPGKFERQIVELTMLDGTKDKMEYAVFAKISHVECDIVSRVTDMDGKITYKVKLEGTGEELEIGENYIN